MGTLVIKTINPEKADLKKLMDLIANDMLKEVDKRFTAGKDPTGRMWDPVARGGRPLRKDGGLKSSINERSTETEAIVGSNKIYARLHNEGWPTGRTNKRGVDMNVKKRQFLGFSISQKDKYDKLVKEEMDKMFILE